MVCIYLCNMETLKYEEMLEALSNPKKRRATSPSSSELKEKRMKYESHHDIPSTSHASLLTHSSSSTSSSNTSVTIPMVIDTMEPMYRYVLIEGMPSPELIQNDCSTKWKIPPPTSFWDVADIQLKKFIEVKVSYDPKKALETYREKKIGMGEHSALCIVKYRLTVVLNT